MKADTRRVIRNFAIEIVIYAILVVIYFLVVLRFLNEPLTTLYSAEPVVYAGLALLLILAQGVALEWITSFLVSLLGLERLE
jgi:hypothetical protein